VRGRVEETEARWLVAGLVAGGAALAVGAAGSVWLVNLEGPFGEHSSRGSLAALGVAVAAGVVTGATTAWLARRSLLALVLWVGVLLGAAVVLLPHRIDVSESFLPRPNQRSSCTGLTFRHYPPGTMDASTTTYCVGIEHPLPRG
jgi:hypothetical protein